MQKRGWRQKSERKNKDEKVVHRVKRAHTAHGPYSPSSSAMALQQWYADSENYSEMKRELFIKTEALTRSHELIAELLNEAIVANNWGNFQPKFYELIETFQVSSNVFKRNIKNLGRSKKANSSKEHSKVLKRSNTAPGVPRTPPSVSISPPIRTKIENYQTKIDAVSTKIERRILTPRNATASKTLGNGQHQSKHSPHVKWPKDIEPVDVRNRADSDDWLFSDDPNGSEQQHRQGVDEQRRHEQGDDTQKADDGLRVEIPSQTSEHDMKCMNNNTSPNLISHFSKHSNELTAYSPCDFGASNHLSLEALGDAYKTLSKNCALIVKFSKLATSCGKLFLQMIEELTSNSDFGGETFQESMLKPEMLLEDSTFYNIAKILDFSIIFDNHARSKNFTRDFSTFHNIFWKRRDKELSDIDLLAMYKFCGEKTPFLSELLRWLHSLEPEKIRKTLQKLVTFFRSRIENLDRNDEKSIVFLRAVVGITIILDGIEQVVVCSDTCDVNISSVVGFVAHEFCSMHDMWNLKYEIECLLPIVNCYAMEVDSC